MGIVSALLTIWGVRTWGENGDGRTAHTRKCICFVQVFTEHLPRAQRCFGCWDSVGDRIAKAYAHTEVHSSHNLLIDGAVAKWEGKKKNAAIQEQCCFQKGRSHVNGKSLPFKSNSLPKYKYWDQGKRLSNVGNLQRQLNRKKQREYIYKRTNHFRAF